MMQRHQPHPAGTFLRCSGCTREPHHIVSRGLPAAVVSDPRAPYVGERHQLECAPCGRVTARAPTLDAAESEWGRAYAQIPMPLRVIHRRRAAA